MFDRVLIVCTGNICRSPLAGALFSRYLPHVKCDTAGLLVDESNLVGQSAAENAQTTALMHGLDLSQHKAKQLEPSLVAESDLILVMTQAQLDLLPDVVKGAKGKALLIGQWINLGSIDDPMGKELSDFMHCYSTLERAVLSWKKRFCIS